MLSYIAYRLAGVLVPLLPRRLGYGLIALAAALMYRLGAGSRRVIHANLRHVLGPQASAAQIDAVARRIFRNLLKNYFDLFWFPAQPEKTIERLITVRNYHYAHNKDNHQDDLIKVIQQ